MPMRESFKRKLGRGDLLIGTIITLPSPEIAEILAGAGFDWLFVDLEHSALGIREAQHILQAAEPQLPCLIRVPAIEEAWIKKALDIGASGIIVPQVKTAEMAGRAVGFGKYPPVGARSVGIARAHGYGADFKDYVASANDETAVIIQIEHIDAVNDIDNILRVPGIDGVFVGPYDLSASMGKIGMTTDPDVQDAISKVKRCAQQAKIPLGIFGASAESVKPYISSGYTLIAAGIDTLLFAKAAKSTAGLLR
jgi:2-dehydro-3-deoxyglucarate aldolase/4-hydroxy-2-oxoheptanedioate aldolase